jgi:hypothetical protein
LVTAFLLAATTIADIRIRFEGEGDRRIWFGTSNVAGVATDPLTVGGSSAAITPDKDDRFAFIEQVSTGNLAVLRLPEQSLGDVFVGEAMFDRIAAIDIAVKDRGEPVPGARVRLNGIEESVEAGMDGVARFHGVRPGAIEITVLEPKSFTSGGSVALRREERIPLVEVDLASVDTGGTVSVPALIGGSAFLVLVLTVTARVLALKRARR